MVLTNRLHLLHHGNDTATFRIAAPCFESGFNMFHSSSATSNEDFGLHLELDLNFVDLQHNVFQKFIFLIRIKQFRFHHIAKYHFLTYVS